MTPTSSPVKFSCKACSAVLSVPAAAPGTVTQGPCPYCGATLRFTHPEPAPQPQPQAAFTAFSAAAPPQAQPPVHAPAPEPAPIPAPAPAPEPVVAAKPQFQQPQPAAAAPARPEPKEQLLPVERDFDSELDFEESETNPVASQLAGTGSLKPDSGAAPHHNPKDKPRSATRRILDLVAILTILALLGAIGWVGWEKFEPEIRDFVAQTGLVLPGADTTAEEIASEVPES